MKAKLTILTVLLLVALAVFPAVGAKTAGPIITPYGHNMQLAGPIITPYGPIITPYGPIITPYGPIITPYSLT